MALLTREQELLMRNLVSADIVPLEISMQLVLHGSAEQLRMIGSAVEDYCDHVGKLYMDLGDEIDPHNFPELVTKRKEIRGLVNQATGG